MQEKLGRLWAGHVFGTNTGNVFVEFTEDRSSGTFRFLDTDSGPVVYELNEVTYSEGRLEFQGIPQADQENVEYGNIIGEGVVTNNGTIRGKWETTLGTGGTFELYPHDILPSTATSEGKQIAQLYTANRTFGAIRLTPETLTQIAHRMQSDFQFGKVVIAYRREGTEIVRFFDEISHSLSELVYSRYIKLSVQEHAAAGLNNVVILEFDSNAENTLMTQGISESWVLGVAERLSASIKRHEQKIINLYRQQGLNLNSIFFLILLALIPEIENVWWRMGFIASVVGLLLINAFIHKKIIPHFLILPSGKGFVGLGRVWGPIFSWGSAVTSALVAAYLFYLLTK